MSCKRRNDESEIEEESRGKRGGDDDDDNKLRASTGARINEVIEAIRRTAMGESRSQILLELVFGQLG